jgi:hypothetical protein
MNTRCSVVVLGALMLTAQAFSARADGTITSIILNPPAIVACADEKITVSATGPAGGPPICGALGVSFGDGQHLLALSGPGQHINFPITFHHRYSKLGTYIVRAQSGGGCPGNVSATPQVAAGPQISSIFSFEVTPGAGILLRGENFGSATGQVEMTVPHYTGAILVNYLQIIDWNDTFVTGTIPAIDGVREGQQAKFTVIAQCGTRSNPWSTAYIPTIDVADLADHTDRLECSMSVGASVSDECLGGGGSNWPPECGGLAMWSVGGFEGYHASGWGGGGRGGWDFFWVTSPLQNGWVLTSATADWTLKVGDVSTASEDPNTTASPGAVSPFMGVNWYVGNCGMVIYGGHMMITGPLGVPF